MCRTTKGTGSAKGSGIAEGVKYVFSQPKEGLVSQMSCGSKHPKGLEYLQRIKCQAAKVSRSQSGRNTQRG